MTFCVLPGAGEGNGIIIPCNSSPDTVRSPNSARLGMEQGRQPQALLPGTVPSWDSIPEPSQGSSVPKASPLRPGCRWSRSFWQEAQSCCAWRPAAKTLPIPGEQLAWPGRLAPEPQSAPLPSHCQAALCFLGSHPAQSLFLAAHGLHPKCWCWERREPNPTLFAPKDAFALSSHTVPKAYAARLLLISSLLICSPGSPAPVGWLGDLCPQGIWAAERVLLSESYACLKAAAAAVWHLLSITDYILLVRDFIPEKSSRNS